MGDTSLLTATTVIVLLTFMLNRSMVFGYGTRRRRIATPAVLLLAMTSIVGCGDNSLTKRVEGVVTFVGQAPPKEGVVRFTPIPGKDTIQRRFATGEFDASGNFTLTTFEDGDGIMPGEYNVNVICWREKPTLATKLSANYVPPDFTPRYVIKDDDPSPVIISIDVPTIQNGS